jgi:hypothetical protein
LMLSGTPRMGMRYIKENRRAGEGKYLTRAATAAPYLTSMLCRMRAFQIPAAATLARLCEVRECPKGKANGLVLPLAW